MPIFTLTLDHSIGLITNSSSELFVFSFEEKKMVEELIVALYPDYEKEYEKPRELKDLTNEEINQWICYTLPYDDYKENWDYPTVLGLDREDIYEIAPKDHYRKDQKYVERREIVTKDNRRQILAKIRKYNTEKFGHAKQYFLYSKGDNPDWDKQELLSQISTRLHLG